MSDVEWLNPNFGGAIAAFFILLVGINLGAARRAQTMVKDMIASARRGDGQNRHLAPVATALKARNT